MIRMTGQKTRVVMISTSPGQFSTLTPGSCVSTTQAQGQPSEMANITDVNSAFSSFLDLKMQLMMHDFSTCFISDPYLKETKYV